MRKLLQSLLLLLAALMVPAAAGAAYVQVAEGVYRDGSTLFITSGVTSLGMLQVNPSVIYCYATVPPACVSNTFTGYGATLHVPTSSMVSYFTAQYWYNFTNVVGDAVEPQAVTINSTEAVIEIGQQYSLSASITPGDAMPHTVSWSTTDATVATVSASGLVTAIAPGECYIRTTCIDKQAICHVTVTPELITITLDKHEARLLPNHMMTLTATCSPATSADLVVTSSDNEVAMPRIVNGKIQVLGLAEGGATITVSTADGLCHSAQCQVTVYTAVGDVNCDGYVNITDVTSLIDFLLSPSTTQVNVTNADTDKSGGVNIADVTALIDYLLQGYWPGEEPWNDWVDLGLPSGTIWATCNVGASSPEDYGDCFAWGETAPKDYYAPSTYKWWQEYNDANGYYTSGYTKYCTHSSYGLNGFVDNKIELDPEDDAAYVNWGTSWRMPSLKQIQELCDNCSWQCIQRNGVYGQLLTGPNGNTMFLPAAGGRWGSSLDGAGSNGSYWSRTLSDDPSGPEQLVFDIAFDAGYWGNDFFTREDGHTVRAVRVP